MVRKSYFVFFLLFIISCKTVDKGSCVKLLKKQKNQIVIKPLQKEFEGALVSTVDSSHRLICFDKSFVDKRIVVKSGKQILFEDLIQAKKYELGSYKVNIARDYLNIKILVDGLELKIVEFPEEINYLYLEKRHGKVCFRFTLYIKPFLMKL